MDDLNLTHINAAITALEYYITDYEIHLIDTNAGDREWNQLLDYRKALTTLKFMKVTYGKE